jgi:hypothetical protein
MPKVTAQVEAILADPGHCDDLLRKVLMRETAERIALAVLDVRLDGLDVSTGLSASACLAGVIRDIFPERISPERREWRR